MLDNVGHLAFVMLYLCTRTQGWFPRYLCNKPQVSQIKSTYLCLQLSHQTSQVGFNRRTMGLRLSPACYRSVLVRFSLGPRSSLVRLSFVSRSLFVSLSNTERGPNEEQAKNERKSNEYRSRCRRETIGNSTSSHLHGWQNTLLQPQTSKMPFAPNLPRQNPALPVHTEHFHGE